MKKKICKDILLSLFAFLFSCQNIVKEDADVSGNIPQRILISDFEDELQTLYTYAGSKSKIEASYTKSLFHGGEFSVLVKANTMDWAGVAIGLGGQRGDWTGMDNLVIWIYGGNSGTFFDITLEDKGQEAFTYQMRDNFIGWKEIIIPVAEFKQRKDWQAANAIKNGRIDFPLVTLHICRTYTGNLELYFDDIEVIRN